MKLLSYDIGTGPRAGVLIDDDHIADASALLGSAMTLRDVQAILEQPESPLDRLRAALEAGVSAPTVRMNDVRLCAPVLRPPTVRDHIVFEEHATGQFTRADDARLESWRRLPIFYFSNPLRITGPDEVVPYPAASVRLDYECELAVVIGRDGSNVLASDADDYIAGFTIYNDWSCRDLQQDESQFGLGPAKGKDAATSLGPWVVTLDEMLPFYRNGALRVRCQVRVNGVTWMDGNAWNMTHSFRDIIERDSQDSRVVPGDIVGSGTVGGGSIGEAIRKGYPARYLEIGDVVELEVEGIGVLRNTIGPSTNPRRREQLRYTAPRLAPLPEPLSAEQLEVVRQRTAAPAEAAAQAGR
jgi:fumarylacetoacetate (FAA) hydrolase